MTALNTVNVHSSLFFQIQQNGYVSRNFLLTWAPQNGINTFENNSTMSYKTRGKKDWRKFAISARGWAEIAVMTNFFSGHDRLLW